MKNKILITIILLAVLFLYSFMEVMDSWACNQKGFGCYFEEIESGNLGGNNNK